MTMLCVTHEMGFDQKVAKPHHLHGLSAQIVEQNTPDDILQQPEIGAGRLFLSQILSH